MVFMFNGTVLCMGVQTSDTVKDSKGSEVGGEWPKFATPIGLQLLDFGVKLKFNMVFEFNKSFKSVRLEFNWKQPCISRKIVQKTDIILKSIMRYMWRWSHRSIKTKLKGEVDLRGAASL